MLKLMGSICILGAGFMLRTFRIQENRREITVLQDLLASFTVMENEIRLNRTPLPRMLPKLGTNREDAVANFFLMISKAAEQGEPLPAAWRSTAVNLPISISGQAAVAELSQKLCGDEEEICNGITLASNSLSRELEQKISCQADFEKHNTAVCLSGAALLAILLI